MNTKLLLTTVALASLFNANAENDPVLMKINNKDVRKSEFEYINNKNTNQQMVEQKDLKEYVDLFVNFKLKVAEAEAQGIDTLESFITELKGYRQQLAQPYLIDSSVDDALAMEAYQRLTENVEASHILIKLDPNASAEQEKEVYEKLMKCKKEIMAGKDLDRKSVV